MVDARGRYASGDLIACRHCSKLHPSKGLRRHERACLTPFTFARLKEISGLTEFPENECWIWHVPPSRRYGNARDPRTGKFTRVSRLAYELGRGVPLINKACHHCDTPACFNPAHLFDGTHLDNMRDMAIKGRGRRTAILKRGIQ